MVRRYARLSVKHLQPYADQLISNQEYLAVMMALSRDGESRRKHRKS
jgi:hypothetical protein